MASSERCVQHTIIQLCSGVCLCVCVASYTLLVSLINESSFGFTGSFLVMVMRMVSLGFDMDPGISRNNEKKPARVPRIPSLSEYCSYCLFPSTGAFGPFLVYEEHIKYLDPSPLVSNN